MLILSYEPPQASVCDYGKVVEAVHSTDTCIGPIHSLAPEVWTANKDSPYDAKIDMWAFGYAIAELLGYSLHLHHPHGIDHKITHDRHTAILNRLCAHRDDTREDAPLVDLVFKLLEWDSEQRYSAEQALEHHCWNLTMQQDSFEEGPAKRVQLKDIRSDTVSTAKNEIETSASITVNTPNTEEVTQATKERFRSRFTR
jgi:serine/threonine protein kinase